MTFAMMFFGLLTVVAALGVVFAAKPLNSALSLVATLFLVAVHFAMLGADFVAALQVLIYAGAIMVLVIFVIMLLGLDEASAVSKFKVPRYLAAVFCGVFLGLLVFAVSSEGIFPVGIMDSVAGGASESNPGSPREVGMVLLTEFIFPFQLAALLLLAAIVGAVLLAHEEKRPLGKGRGLSAMQQKNSSEEELREV